jgi:hypothetical protein
MTGVDYLVTTSLVEGELAIGVHVRAVNIGHTRDANELLFQHRWSGTVAGWVVTDGVECLRVTDAVVEGVPRPVYDVPRVQFER